MSRKKFGGLNFFIASKGRCSWIRKKFRLFAKGLEKPKNKCPNSSVYLSGRFKASNRDGGRFRCILSGRCFFWQPWKKEAIKILDPAGRFEVACPRPEKPAQPGNSRRGTSAGSSMGRSARGSLKRVGPKKWRFAGNVRFLSPTWNVEALRREVRSGFRQASICIEVTGLPQPKEYNLGLWSIYIFYIKKSLEKNRVNTLFFGAKSCILRRD